MVIRMYNMVVVISYINGLVQERCNSIDSVLELRLSCTNPLLCLEFCEMLSVWLL